MKTQRRIFKLTCTGLAFGISMLAAKTLNGFWPQSFMFWGLIIMLSTIHSLSNYAVGQNVFYKLVYRGLTFDNDRMLVVLSNGMFYWLWLYFHKGEEMKLYLKIQENG